jgi:alkanesulfonate monooxygenase SsuD/methylene tetrahydromethanopterin reductase-like flavin-dependent oxidoreductase (luciferase family)
MRVSISVTNYSWTGEPAEHLDAIARTADETGIDTLWVADHLLQVDPTADPAHTEHLEALTTLGFLAARTERVRLGTMVACVTFRPPAVLVKAVGTLAVLSGGRAWFGVGAGHQADEAHAMGLPFPATAQRFEYLEDTLLLAHRMWAGDESPFQGKQIRLQHPVSSPNPPVRPRILVGGTGERRTLPLVARYADACNVFDIPDGGATVRHKLAVLADLCDAAGRPYDEIEKTISTRLLPDESGDAFAERCSQFADLGVDHVIVITRGPWTTAGVRAVSQVRAV